jgi:hypothetical protein
MMTIQDDNEAGIYRVRAENAKTLSAFYRCETNIHPHGISGLRVLTPNSSDCTDTHPLRWEGSEWGNQCGIV